MQRLKRVTLILSIIFFAGVSSAQYAAFENLPLNDIRPAGWQRAFLLKQRDGLTGHLDELCEPFNKGGWIADPTDWEAPFYKRTIKGKDVLCWEPYEQAGYYYDGVLRCGLLLGDDLLQKKATDQIYVSIEEASKNGGIIRGDIPNDRWPHVCFFRSFMAEYEATNDRTIPDALMKHYDNDPCHIWGCRSIINIEQLVWLGQQTGEQKYIQRAVDLYEAQAFRGDRLVNTYADLVSDQRQDIHGVTFLETLKLPIILYMATGDEKYLDAARNGYRKLDRFHMLADGIPSSEEGLSENGCLSAHETCDVSDYVWTTSYMLKATGEVEWADRIERAVLNGGLGCVTKNFDAHQYLSTMNQISATLGSSRSPFSNAGWGAYAQRQMPWCCTGNVNRFFPIYAGLQWLRAKDGGLVKALYGPGECTFNVEGETVKFREDSFFPFSNEIKIQVEEGEAKFPFSLRIPSWTKNPTISVNGTLQKNVKPGEFFVLLRTFRKGDEIMLNFPKKVRFKQVEMNGMTVDYGPLLFSLPVSSKTEKILLNEWIWSNNPTDSKELYGYNMLPAGKWKYVLIMDEERGNLVQVKNNPDADEDNPWDPDNPPIRIQVVGAEFPLWKNAYQKFKPLKGKERMVEVTPNLPPRGCMTMVRVKCKKPELITLVPYGSTTLRMTIFPYWNAQNIPSFKPNQLDYGRAE